MKNSGALIRQGIVRGVDLRVLAARFWRLDSMRASAPAPQIQWHAHEWGSGAWGRAHVLRNLIHLRLGHDVSIEEAVEVLLHEIVHCACPRGTHHGELFKRRLIGCAREAFGLDLPVADLLALPPKNGRIAYAIDNAIFKAMVEIGIGARLLADPACHFEPAPEEPEELIAARREVLAVARAASREGHARAMLAQWERKTKMAEKRAAKWRAKVKYYERQAAKRSPS